MTMTATAVLLAMFAAAVAPALAASLAKPGTLRAVLDRAALLDPALQALDARAGEVDASRAVAASLFPAAPSVAASVRRDRPDRDLGGNEIEFDLGVPLWLPGQRALRERLADGEGSEREVALIDARLQLAGRVREALWQVVAAQVELAAVRRRVENVERLVADVERRVTSGILARTDLLLAQSEAAASRGLLIDGTSRVKKAMQAWSELTGEHALPERYVEASAAAGSASPAAARDDARAHPSLAAATGQIVLAHSRLQFASEVRRDPPELGLQHRSDRDVSGADYRNSIRVSLRIPFATDSRNRPRIAAANTELIRAQSGLQQLQRRLASEKARAQAELDAAGAQQELARERQRIAREHLALIQRAFDLGEQSLVALLRAIALASDVDAEVERQAALRDRAVARLNQAAGVLP